MNLIEFAEEYAKEKGIKLTTHEKGMLKSISEGKMFYHNPNESIIQDIIDAHSDFLKDKDNISVDKNETL